MKFQLFKSHEKPARSVCPAEPRSAETPAERADAFLRRHHAAPEQFDLRAVTDAFLAAMREGLSGSSGLPMLPTYLSPDWRMRLNEPVAVLDLGGTNLRTAVVTFRDGVSEITGAAVRPVPGTDAPVSWEDFIGEAADALAPLLDGVRYVGLCFCYPAESTPELDARPLGWTKELRITGWENQLVCRSLAAALAARGRTGLRFALLNDTPAAYLRGSVNISHSYTNGFIGMVCGTGTNTCCAVPVSMLEKLGRPDDDTRMLVNLESGAFCGVPQSDFDRALDRSSENPGAYLFEKMTGGRYLGELCRLALTAAAEEGLFSAKITPAVRAISSLSAPDADLFAFAPDKDRIPAFAGADSSDCEISIRILRAVFTRAARAIVANITAILLLFGGADNRYRPLVISTDGSLYEKSTQLAPAVAELLKSYLQEEHARYCVCKPVANSTLIGTAAAVLAFYEAGEPLP